MPGLTLPSLAVVLCLVTPCLGANFSKGAAAAAVEKLMPSDGPKEFVMFNMTDPKSSSEQLGYMLKEAHEESVALAICGPKLQPIREMLAAEPDTEWSIVEDEDKVTTYVARFVGQSGPVILSIYDAVEPGWEIEGGAEETLRNMGVLETLITSWE